MRQFHLHKPDFLLKQEVLPQTLEEICYEKNTIEHALNCHSGLVDRWFRSCDGIEGRRLINGCFSTRRGSLDKGRKARKEAGYWTTHSQSEMVVQRQVARLYERGSRARAMGAPASYRTEQACLYRGRKQFSMGA